jgi:hypothetical protein
MVEKFYKKVDNFLEKPLSYKDSDIKKLLIIFLSLNVLFGIITFIVNPLLAYLSIGYFFFCLFLFVIFYDYDVNIIFFKLSIILIIPYIFILKLSMVVLDMGIPYSGSDKLILRGIKLKKLKRKLIINKFKFWKWIYLIK